MKQDWKGRAWLEEDWISDPFTGMLLKVAPGIACLFIRLAVNLISSEYRRLPDAEMVPEVNR